MARGIIIVEGQTEEKFVKEVLIPYFYEKGIYSELNVSILPSKIERDGRRYKGGAIKFDKVVEYIKRTMNSYDFVTTLFDYYGIDEEFKGYKESLMETDIKKKKNLLEKELLNVISSRKLIPYIQMHEFEALIFSDLESLKYLEDNIEKIKNLKKDVSMYLTPEHINNSRETAPSKRILSYYKSYKKTIDGIIVLKRIGLPKIVEQCPLFEEWIKNIEIELKK